MNVRSIIKLVNRKHLWSLFLLSIKHPLYVIPTLFATRSCMRISSDHYGKLHHKNNVTNAFRHALWNILIIRRCKHYAFSIEKAIKWAEKITTWHEDFSPNQPLARKMDLHNNCCGRQYFKANPDFREADFISLLKIEIESAVIIKSLADFNTFDTTLVYLEELPENSHA